MAAKKKAAKKSTAAETAKSPQREGTLAEHRRKFGVPETAGAPQQQTLGDARRSSK